jgi:creatinine amidohydrolase
MSWTQLSEILKGPDPPAVLLPLGAVEAHGPHLPLDTDTVIAEYLAGVVAGRLVAGAGARGLVAHPLPLSCAGWAADFAGTVSLAPETAKALLRDSIGAIRRSGAKRIVLVNLHFDPGHMAVVRDMIHSPEGAGVVFTDFTRRATAARIGGEFASGSCHGGSFETSLMLEAAPSRVKILYRSLPRIDVDLAAAIHEGKRSFHEVGMPQGYCGDPAAAHAQEGRRLYGVLADIIVEECRAAWAHPA